MIFNIASETFYKKMVKFLFSLIEKSSYITINFNIIFSIKPYHNSNYVHIIVLNSFIITADHSIFIIEVLKCKWYYKAIKLIFIAKI